MIKAVKQIGKVGKGGKIEIDASELLEGTEVEIIILAVSPDSDTTDYLLSTSTNYQELFAAIERVEKGEDLVVITPEEWHEKYCI